MSPQEPARTIWTKSLFEGLYMAIERKDPKAVAVAMADLAGKDFPLQEVLRHVRADQGAETEQQLQRLLQPQAADDGGGLVGKIKKLFS